MAPQVVVVLAGGGAKGFAHLAVLRRLERDHVRIARIVGTSMGAVIGGLYASGMSADEIESVVGGLDPGRVALDQLDRQELPLRTRNYQKQYPIDFEFGVQNGQLSFARGLSDGQRFLELLQRLTHNVPPSVRFDDLKIPFRAVATRYRDGEPAVFSKGSLALAIRASMAAPAVFSPVEIDGESYVDGGLVANVPIEIALREGADTLVVSYLGQEDPLPDGQGAGNAMTVANRMLDILIRQNERRNLALLRPQDILVQPELPHIGFTDFGRAAEISALGDQAVARCDESFRRLAGQAGSAMAVAYPRLAFDQREIRIGEIEVHGNQAVPEGYIRGVLLPLLGQEPQSVQINEMIDRLYTSGYFERVSYELNQVHGDHYVMQVEVKEKSYGPHYLKTNFGFSSEMGGVNQFSIGLGYRRPWLTEQGLELAVDARVGTQSELSARLYQPIGQGWSLEGYNSWQRNVQPIYSPPGMFIAAPNQKLAYAIISSRTSGLDLGYEVGRLAIAKLGLADYDGRMSFDTSSAISVETLDGTWVPFPDSSSRMRYTGAKASLLADQLDSVNFPTQGYYLNLSGEQGLGSARFRSSRVEMRVAQSMGKHIFNVGLNLGSVRTEAGDTSNGGPTDFYLGGFQMMGAYRMGQLEGDRLVHGFGTYMYELSDGGLFRQRTYVGTVLERGDAWLSGIFPHVLRRSTTWFIAVDSKIGDIYLGLAEGSQGARNAFIQLGRRFSF